MGGEESVNENRLGEVQVMTMQPQVDGLKDDNPSYVTSCTARHA